MTVVPQIKFTPELLIEAPRRSSAVPNAAGTLALFTSSTYSLDSHSETKEIKILSLKDGSSILFSNAPEDKDAQWLGDEDQILWLRKGKDGETEVWIGNAEAEKNAYLAGTVAASISNVQTCSLGFGSENTIAVAFGAPTTPKGELLNTKKVPRPLHTAREYSAHPVRFWDAWVPPERSSLYYTILKKTETAGGTKWKLSGRIFNALKGTRLRFPSLPSGFANEGGSIAVSPTGILLSTLEPSQNLAQRALYALYYIRLKTFQEEPHGPQRIVRIKTPGWTGSQTGATFTASGTTAAFLVTKDGSNDSSSPIGICIVHFNESSKSVDVRTLLKPRGDGPAQSRAWDRRPSALLWANDKDTLYLIADDSGQDRLFKLPNIVTHFPLRDRPNIETIPMPERLTTDGSVMSVYTLNRAKADTGYLLVTMSGILESSLYARLNPSTTALLPVSSATKRGSLLGFNAKQLSSVTFKGAGDYDVQAWITRPSYFDSSKRYPLALLIHGGPQSAWWDKWSTRWNHAVFAEQGYVVVAPNPSGSSGFGDEFLQAVEGDWGGRPYDDIVKCFEYVEEHLSYVDTRNAVALGASYGGYMVNWIAGQPLAKKLKAIVSHDGIFSNTSMMSSDFVAGLDREAGGTQWDRRDLWEKFSPSSYTRNWNTPMLVIHSDNDFRCPINEGLAAYSVCQAKGIESRFLNFPDENHFVLNRENSLKWHHTVLGWINKFTGVKGGVVLDEAYSDAKWEEE